ncbi:MAG: ATP-binding protein [Actinobacteria bacterium]|nr:ATP-binding protein [Actinomycetota bacterium]
MKKSIREKLDPALLSSLSFNFRSPTEAVCELIDNAVDDIVAGEPMTVTITCRRGSLSVTGKGGNGMDLEKLEDFLHWGKQTREKGRLGRYGQGGKSAMGYLGCGWVIRANPRDGDTQFVIRDENWRDRSEGLKEYAAEEERSPVPGVGVVQIEVKQLERKPNVKKLREELSWRYAPLIRTGKIKLVLNDKQVEPEDISTVRSKPFKLRIKDVPSPYPGDKHQPDHQLLEGWVGIKKTGADVKGGIRVSASGRVIVRDEFFGHKTPAFKASLNNLVGEVEMGFIPLKLNKDDFDRDSPGWRKCASVMRRVMKPYVDELLARKDEELPSDEEIERAMLARDYVFKALERLEEAYRLKGNSGTAEGQRQPTKDEEKEAVESQEEGEPRGPYEPATPPPPSAVGKRKRKAKWGDFDVRPMEESIRSIVVKEKGRRTLVINNRFPAYRASRGEIMYMVETAAVELARPEPDEPQDASTYHETMNIILAEVSLEIMKQKRGSGR